MPILIARGWQLGPSRILPPSVCCHALSSQYAIEASFSHGRLRVAGWRLLHIALPSVGEEDMATTRSRPAPPQPSILKGTDGRPSDTNNSRQHDPAVVLDRAYPACGKRGCAISIPTPASPRHWWLRPASPRPEPSDGQADTRGGGLSSEADKALEAKDL